MVAVAAEGVSVRPLVPLKELRCRTEHRGPNLQSDCRKSMLLDQGGLIVFDVT